MFRACPKCGGILSDSAKICMDCRYQFKPGELQEIWNKDKNVREITKKQSKKKKKIITIISLSILSVCLSVTAFILVCGTEISFGEDYIWFGGSRAIPYEYFVYRDHAVVNYYYGRGADVDIPDRLWGRPVTVIGSRCFPHRYHIIKVKIPKTVVEIEAGAFAFCFNLVEVTGGEEVKVVGNRAFADCPNLAVVDLGTKIERIGYAAFGSNGCIKLKQFAPQDHLEYIGYYAFSGSGLEEFEFNSNAVVQAGAFKDTPWIYKQAEPFLIFGEGALLYYNGPEGKIVIPDGVKTMMEGSVEGLKDSEIFLSQTVREIEYTCFEDCTNIKIYIPSSVEKMESEILYNCSDVTIITTKGSYAEKYAKEHEIPCEIVEGW